MAARYLDKEFWALYVLGWLVFSSAYASVHFLTDARSFQSSVIATIMVVAPAAALGAGVFAYARALENLTANWRIKGLVHLASAFTYAIVWIFSVWTIRTVATGLSAGMFKLFFPPEHVVHWHLLSGSTVYAMLVAVFYAGMHADAKWRAEKDAEIRTALGKFDPHFLFNTLTAIRQLLKKDPGLAEEAHDRLAVLLRESLRADLSRTHTVRRELDLCRTYLDLQRLRLGERLSVRQQIDEDLLSYEVPCLILQPLVENAIRHGVEPLEKGGTIQISARRNASAVEFMISNDAPDESMANLSRASGHGLRIVTARLHQFETGATCSTSRKDGRFTVKLALPARNLEGEHVS